MWHLWRMETILSNCLIKSVVHSFAKCMQDFRRFLSWTSFASLNLGFWSTVHLWLHSAHAKLITGLSYPKETLHEGLLRHEWVLQSWNTASIVWLEGILVVFVIYVGVSLIAILLVSFANNFVVKDNRGLSCQLQGLQESHGCPLGIRGRLHHVLGCVAGELSLPETTHTLSLSERAVGLLAWAEVVSSIARWSQLSDIVGEPFTQFLGLI